VDTLVEVVRWLQTATFLLVAVWALNRWRTQGDAASAWLASTFATIGLVVAVGAVTELLPESAHAPLIDHVVIAVLVAFPYLLLRFLDGFEPVPRLGRRVLGGTILLLMAAALVVPLPQGDEPRSAVFNAFALAVVASWVIVLPYVGLRFFLAGRGQPTLARRRLRLLAVASGALSVAIVLAGVASSATQGITLVTQLFALTSAALFLVGFAPPGLLRRLWRYPEEQELHAAAVNLMATRTEAEVAGVLLPHLRRVVGAHAVALSRDGDVLGSDGLGPREHAEMEGQQAPTSLTSQMSNGTLHLWLNPYIPFFGAEELDLLERLGLLADLALDRAALLESETEARAALEHANAELESFVYSASHDLKSPLIAILGYVDLLTDDHRDELGEDGRWYLERMLTNGRYMEALIRDLLEFSRIGRMQTSPERVSLTDVARDVATEVRRQHPDATIRVDPLPVLLVNGVRARQLLANLVENAAKHGDDRVTITITSTPAADGGAEVAVVDDGPGIPAAYRDLVFGVFERLSPDDAHTGTGIGLAICRKIVESSGGRIWVADRDQGAEFRMHFPATVVLAPAGAPKEVPA
jgi:signal transduction histidine kinase